MLSRVDGPGLEPKKEKVREESLVCSGNSEGERQEGKKQASA